ncbi:hypothetical protein HMPREF2907_04015 [Neisseria sp. HMSC055H02]|jgi:hypothetical protein|nr:hypothetical protein HMPREF2907_04015 [Neisseria sp. HMSC055H02]
MFFVQYVQTQYFQLLISAKKAVFYHLIWVKKGSRDGKTGKHNPICAEKQAKPPFRRPFPLQRAQKKLPEQHLGVAVPTA